VTEAPTIERPVRRPALAGLLVRFVTVGGLSVGSDVVVLVVLHSLLGVALLPATAIGNTVSLAINYTLNHGWVFEASGEHHRRLVRYFTLVAFNVVSTLAFVEGLTAAGLHYLLAKAVAVAVNAVVNFTGFRYWVFR
jgi:putative flippase GtrA